jgi:hypothetical protein
MRGLAMVVVSVGLALAAAPDAAAAGGPVSAVQGWGVSAPGSPTRYLALGVGRDTLLERLDPPGNVTQWRTIRGAYGVAGAASDGSTTGLSADGGLLVLPRLTNNYPPTRTSLAVVDPRHLRVVRHITLPGFYTVDAISPAGDWLYLIHYTSARNLLRYEVRAYDLVHDRLLDKPVIDPREPDEKMAGTAMTRVYSPGGRWAYTLYQRQSGAAFVHALDTASRTARCIDLPDAGNGQMNLTLDPRGTTLRYTLGGQIEALVDTRTFTVTRPGTRPAAAPRKPPKDSGGGTPVWPAALVAVALVAALAGLRRRRAAYAG